MFILIIYLSSFCFLLSIHYYYKKLLNSGFNLSFLWKCVPVDYTRTAQAMNMQHAMYYTFLIKAFELIETIFFILRKKTNQVTFLHVYHHASTFTLTWFFVKFIPGKKMWWRYLDIQSPSPLSAILTYFLNIYLFIFCIFLQVEC